jgi:hypothetical protein
MSQLKGDDIVLYSYESLNPIGCEESCILNITSNEIITTTKGSGRATNREYGSYDWNIQGNGIVGPLSFFKVNPLKFGDDILTGKKVVVKIGVREWFYFGIGIVTSFTLNGTTGESATYDVTIAGDGELLRTGNLINEENEPKTVYGSLAEDETVFTYSDLIGATLLIIFYKDSDTNGFQEANSIYYTFDDEAGTVTFDDDVYIAPFEFKIFYVPA